MKVTIVKHARKAAKCSRCGARIKPSRDEKKKKTVKGKRVTRVVRVLGDPYRWIKFKGRGRTVRCMNSACGFRPSDMTTSDKLSRAYGAQEAAEDQIAALSWDAAEADDLVAIRDDMVSELREVIDDYNASADSMESAFPNGCPTMEDCREKAEALEGWADNIEQWEPQEWEPEDEDAEEPCNADGQTREEWGDAQAEALSELVGDCPV